MTKMPETAKLLAQLNAKKKRFGTHPCCNMLITGPHSMECPVEHLGPYYAEGLDFHE